MPNRDRLVSVVLVGFVAGLLGAAIAASPPSRAQQFAAHFEDICIANHFGMLHTAPEVWGYEPVRDTDGDDIWIHPRTVAVLRLKPGRCSLETLAPHALSAPDARELLGLVETLVKEYFPDLPRQPDFQLGSVYGSWMTGPWASPSRWGISFYAAPEWGPNASSALTITAPAMKPEATTWF